MLTVWLMTFVVFLLSRLTGNPLDLILSPYASPEQYELAARQLGLDGSLAEQYARFLVSALQGDFGASLYFKKSAMDVVLERLPATLILATCAMTVAIIIAVPVGVMSAASRDSYFDAFWKTFAMLGQAMPNFLLGILLIQLFSVTWRIFPAGGFEGVSSLVLPALTLGWFVAAGMMRLARSSTIDTLQSEYIVLARAKGLPERKVVWKHAFGNALVPVLTFSGMIFAQLLVGSIVVETVFSWPGVGWLAYQAVIQKDFPLLQSVVLLFTLIYVLMNFFVDLLCVWLDPRVSLQ